METDPIDIPDTWALTPADLALVMAKNEANRVDFALLLLFYRAHGRFPNEPEEIKPVAVASLARQLGMEGVANNGFNTADRTWKRHRAEIRALLGYREATVADAEALSEWLSDQVATAGGVPEHLAALLNARCRELSIEPPSADRSERIVRTAIYAYDERFYASILNRLTPATRTRLDALLQPAGNNEESASNKEPVGTAPALLLQLRDGPGRPSLGMSSGNRCASTRSSSRRRLLRWRR